MRSHSSKRPHVILTGHKTHINAGYCPIVRKIKQVVISKGKKSNGQKKDRKLKYQWS